MISLAQVGLSTQTFMVYFQVKYNLQVLASCEGIDLYEAQVYGVGGVVLLRKLSASFGWAEHKLCPLIGIQWPY